MSATNDKYDSILESIGCGVDGAQDRALEEGRRSDEMALRKMAIPLARLRMKEASSKRNPFARLREFLSVDERALKREMSNLDHVTKELIRKIGDYGGIPTDKKFLKFFVAAGLVELAGEALTAGTNVLMDAIDDYEKK